jgi:NAD(P)-dependent dehydrogenase (short-subunit alcohol dehydrogenase family)
MSTTTETTPELDALSHAARQTDGVPKSRNLWRLVGKVGVITGGSTGMGLATAKRFVQEGMDHVFITGRRKDLLDAAVAQIGAKATGIPGDVANLNDLDRLYEAVERYCQKRYGQKIDVIFANAGVAAWRHSEAWTRNSSIFTLMPM